MSSTASPFTKDRPLRVLTMNIYNFSNSYQERQVLIRDGIQKLDPDVMAFQEAGYDGKRHQVADAQHVDAEQVRLHADDVSVAAAVV